MGVVNPKDIMLATEQPHTLTDSGQWCYQFKVDGWRALTDGKQLMSRQGKNITEYLPQGDKIRFYNETGIQDLYQLPEGTVLDGELVNISQNGVMNSSRIASTIRDNYYYAFDVLTFDKVDVRNIKLSERMDLLKEIADKYGFNKLEHTYKPEKMWDRMTEYNMEGLVAKRSDSPYRGGRSNNWIKVFNPTWRRPGT